MPSSEYRGRPASPDSVKKIVDFRGMSVRLDRPKGFVMRGKTKDGKEWERVYQYDYGFLKGTAGGDGDGVDVFLGPDKSSGTAFWAVQVDDQGKFDEYKVFLGFPSKGAAVAAYKQHIPSRFLKSMTPMRLEMMKALMGIGPVEKVASYVSMLDELTRIQFPAFLYGTG